MGSDTNMNICIFGDSFCLPDPDYPGLHWSEKILDFSPDYTVHNCAMGGASNALINLQLLQSLKTKVDFVIISFTAYHRYEVDNNIDVLPRSTDLEDLTAYRYQRYCTQKQNHISHSKKNLIDQYLLEAASHNFEKLKDYFFISHCLNTLDLAGIPFAFTLGGYAWEHDYTKFIESNFIENVLTKYQKNMIPINLWYYNNGKSRPYFHVDNEQALTLFANECIHMIERYQT